MATDCCVGKITCPSVHIFLHFSTCHSNKSFVYLLPYFQCQCTSFKGPASVHFLTVFSKCGGLLKARVAFILKVYIFGWCWYRPKFQHLLKWLLWKISCMHLNWVLLCDICVAGRGDEAEVDNIRIVRHLYRRVFVFYWCRINYHNFSDLGQHIRIISQARSPGTA